MTKENWVDLVLTVVAVLLVAWAVAVVTVFGFGEALVLTLAAALVVTTGNRLTAWEARAKTEETVDRTPVV